MHNLARRCFYLSALLAAWTAVLVTPVFTAQKADEIVVKYKPGYRAAFSASPVVAGARVTRAMDQIRTHAIKLPTGVKVEDAIKLYRSDPNVEYAGPNHIVSICLAPDDEFYYDSYFDLYWQWGLYDVANPDAGIDAESAWDITTGSTDIIIASVDTGVLTNHEDLYEKIVPGRNVITGAPDPTDADDDQGHGTFTAGETASMTNNGLGIAGVSWGARIMPIKALDANGYGTEADAAAGIIWAADHGAKIINMSFGGYDDVPVEKDAVDYAWSKGCVLVGASGNDGTTDIFYPASYDNVIAVGASNEYMERCTEADWGEGGSNYGGYLDVMAPGNNIWSTYYNDEWGFGPYMVSSGTSAAAPFVSGIAALLWSEHPDWTNTQIAEQIKSSCKDMETAGWDQYTGWGLVSAYRALTQAPIQTITLAQTNSIAGGNVVRVGDAVITSGSTDIPGRLYVAQADRACAIQLPFTTNPTGYIEGDIVAVTGTVITVDGERSIQGATLTKTGNMAPLKPFAMTQKYIGGGRTGMKSGVTDGMGANNISQLVTVYGRVTVASRYDYFYIDDGSGLDNGTGLMGLKVITRDLVKPAKGDFVRVTGISSVERPYGPNTTIPVLRARRQGDILVM